MLACVYLLRRLDPHAVHRRFDLSELVLNEADLALKVGGLRARQHELAR